MSKEKENTLQKLQPRPAFELPAHFEIWVEATQQFAHLHVFKVHLKCEDKARTLNSKAFNPAKEEEAARAWLEFMSMVGNIIITSVMPPDMLHLYVPQPGGGMTLRKGES